MDEKVKSKLFRDGKIPEKEQIREWLKKDIQGVYVLLSEMLYTPEVLDAMVEVFHARAIKIVNEQLVKDAILDQKEHE